MKICRLLARLMGICALTSVTALAQEAPLQQTAAKAAQNGAEEAALYPYAQFGVMVRPKDVANGDYGGFYTWPEMVSEMNRWLRDYPSIIRVQSLGRTIENRPIPLFVISNNPDQDEDEPELLYLTGLHPREQPPTITIMNFVNDLLRGYGKDAEITELVNTRKLWVVPMLNVDGKIYDMQHGDGKTKGAGWRKNRRPNSDGSYGVDLNRNFPARWGGSRGVAASSKKSLQNMNGTFYEGIGPASEPETRAIMQFIEQRPLRVVMDMHSSMDSFNLPPFLSPSQHAIYSRLTDQMRAAQTIPTKVSIAVPGSGPTDENRQGNNGVSYMWSDLTTGAYSMNFETKPVTREELFYVSPEFTERQYRENMRGPMLALLRESANLPMPKRGVNSFGPSQWEGTPRAGERVVWKPQIEGDYDYAFVSSASAAGVVKLEYRLAPATEGFPIQIQPDARKGARIPLKLHVWDKNRGLSVLEEELVVE